MNESLGRRLWEIIPYASYVVQIEKCRATFVICLFRHEQPRVKPWTEIPCSGNGMNVRVNHADTCDVDLFHLSWCANNEKFSPPVVVQFKIVIHKRISAIFHAFLGWKLAWLAKCKPVYHLHNNEIQADEFWRSQRAYSYTV